MQLPGRLQSVAVALACLFAGALVTLSLAPYNFWPAGILSCLLLCALLDRATPRQALWRGWLYGCGFFGAGTSWVYVSIHVYGYAPVPLALFLTALFCAGLALFQLLFAWCYVRWVRGQPAGVLLGFPALWVLSEWLRSWLLTGFPWLYLGYGHLDTPLSGWAPVTGVYGLSFACAITASCLFISWRRRRISVWVSTALALLITWAGGALLRPVEWVAPASEEPLQVAFYQPNIPQELKWERSYLPHILRQYGEAMGPLYGKDIVIWPESAVPRYFQDMQDWFRPIAERTGNANGTLISGVPYRGDSAGEYYNSVVALGDGAGVYHKQRLVPFGEYVPLEDWLRGLIAFFDLPMSGFSAGDSDQPPLLAGPWRVAPLICYEIAYPQQAAEAARSADLLLTVSNDSWFGDSIGPLQHLEMAQMRALENGRYVLRGTNNGVSAIIDPRGKITAASEQFEETVLTGEAQVMLGRTPFTSFGVWPMIGGCLLALFAMGIAQRR
ncbi:apolipoprotein N-acyltransferase [Parahaliea aestuarii]|uniref:Apolipoprotein N-acyltransferase n=1 Tax=Parahaliea aestuarii TaxID=1852021 RepID=A0A5C8ZR65_9GAMM|nr:apolipoprotein N-acyltransferase [Parahaliea aestuarii]TXS90150.1 apolipoprotein N-acyltransferase [Parahaliea aestuarii]